MNKNKIFKTIWVIALIFACVWIYHKYTTSGTNVTYTSDTEIEKIGTPNRQEKSDFATQARALDDNGGHSWADHGAHVTEAQQLKRLQTGETPGGSHRDIPAIASNFTSNEMHMKAYQDAINQLNQKYGNTKGKKTIVISGKGFESMGISYNLSNEGNLQKHAVNGYRAVFRLDKHSDFYKLVTLFPQ